MSCLCLGFTILFSFFDRNPPRPEPLIILFADPRVQEVFVPLSACDTFLEDLEALSAAEIRRLLTREGVSVLATEGTRRGKHPGNMHLPGALIDLDLGKYEIPEMDGNLNVLRFRFKSHPNVRIIILYCIVLYCIVLSRVVSCRVVSYCIVL